MTKEQLLAKANIERLAILGNASALAEVKQMNPRMIVRRKFDDRYGTILVCRGKNAKPGAKWKILAR